MNKACQQDFLNANEIAQWPVALKAPENGDLNQPLRDAIIANDIDHSTQAAGHHFAMGCVALEITQRCNLDCTACYLSDYSEAVKDLPLEEVFRRIDQIADHYGPNTNVQVTGGDPTLRKREELVAIVAHLKKRNLNGALFTNGIKATRNLLIELKQAGLKDVAFHVDMTQERKGYDSEEALNEIREDYIARARGLGLQIIFNTTLFEGNIEDVTMLSRFFKERANDIHLASFQMIADTGRGTERKRTAPITQERVMNLISQGAGTELGFDFPQVGHLECNRYAKCLVAGDESVSAFEPRDRAFFEKLMPFARHLHLSRHKPVTSVIRLATRLMNGNMGIVFSGFSYAFRKLWSLRRGLIKNRARANLITFYIHNFMHAHALEKDRCESCVFMTMTRDGPISMCVHNAKRDDFILQEVHQANGSSWNPLGTPSKNVEDLPLKRLKGRARTKRLDDRAQNRPPRMAGLIGEIDAKQRAAEKTLVS